MQGDRAKLPFNLIFRSHSGAFYNHSGYLEGTSWTHQLESHTQTSGPQEHRAVPVGSHHTDECSATATLQGPQEKELWKMLFSGEFLSKALGQAPLEKRLSEEA